MLAVPLRNQFEQSLNALYLEKLGQGEHCEALDEDRVRRFLERAPRHAARLAGYKQDGNKQILDAIKDLIRQIMEKGPRRHDGSGHRCAGGAEPRHVFCGALWIKRTLLEASTMRYPIVLFSLFAAPLLLSPACAPNDIDGPVTIEVEGAQGSRPISVTVPVRKRGSASADEFAAASTSRMGGTPLPIFLNRNGGTYRAGTDDSSTNTSSVVQEQGISSATIPRYQGSNAAWAQVVDCLKDEFARFHVNVTDTDPGAVPHIEAVFGGNGSEMRFPGNVGGVSPIDPQDCALLDRAIVYIFTGVLGSDTQEICEVGAQEIAHAISLDHELLASDPLTYLSFAGHKVFQDQAARCGEFSARACVCNRPNQNSVQTLAAKLGWAGTMPPPPPPGDTVAPQVTIQRPADGATLPANATLEIVATASDNVAVTRVDLLWKYNGAVLSCPGSAQCRQSGSTYTFTLNVGTGDRAFQVRASDAAGNTAVTPERTVRLGGGGPPPPNPGPVVRLLQPAPGTSLRAGSTLAVSADVQDPDGVASVQLVWSGPAGSSTFPLSAGSGATWGLNLQVSATAAAGPRQVAVRATDRLGATTTTAPVTVTVTR